MADEGNEGPTNGTASKLMIWQEHDIWYVIDRVQEHFPGMSRDAAHRAVLERKGEVKPAEGRERLLQSVVERLNGK
jgi:hypothetical protein